MTRQFTRNSHDTSCCVSYAGACTSAHMIPIMDTAMILVVSICVILSIIGMIIHLGSLIT